jgi:hypothetical protein
MNHKGPEAHKVESELATKTRKHETDSTCFDFVISCFRGYVVVVGSAMVGFVIFVVEK